MRSFAIVLTLVAGSFGAGAAQSKTTPEDVTAETFAAFCDEAKASTDVVELRALFASAEADRIKVEERLEAAEAETTAATDELISAAIRLESDLGKEIHELSGQIAALRRERDRLSAVMTKEKKGPEYERAYRERLAKMEEIATLDRQQLDAVALRDGLITRMAEAEAAGDALGKAKAILPIVSDIGFARAASFAPLAARLTGADSAAGSASAILDKAASSIDCVEKRLATLENAGADEAEFLRNGTITLGQEMKAKGQALAKAEKSARDAWSKFSLSGNSDDAGIEEATNAYVTVMEDYLAIGQEFQSQVARLESKGLAIEPWMTQLIAHYEGIEATADKVRASARSLK